MVKAVTNRMEYLVLTCKVISNYVKQINVVELKYKVAERVYFHFRYIFVLNIYLYSVSVSLFNNQHQH